MVLYGSRGSGFGMEAVTTGGRDIGRIPMTVSDGIPVTGEKILAAGIGSPVDGEGEE